MRGQVFIAVWLSATFVLASSIPSGRIIQGTPVPLGALPWQVLLKKSVADDLLCGGSIIAPNWVLTAGHCTYGLSSIFLVFGTIDLRTYNVSMTSTQLIIHPEYDPETLNNDVSLIKLPSSLTYSKYIQEIKLVSSADAQKSFLGASALIAGFGYTDDEILEYSNSLLAAMVVIIDNAVCEEEFSNEIVIHSTMCSSGASGKQSICSGDSGGPLITLDAKENRFIQIGINSFVAHDACTEGFPAGYARLTSFISFIESTIESHQVLKNNFFKSK